MSKEEQKRIAQNIFFDVPNIKRIDEEDEEPKRKRKGRRR